VDRLQRIPLAREINEAMPEHMRALTEEALAEFSRKLVESRVALLGAAYQQTANDPLKTPAAVPARLLALSGADVVTHDPFAREEEWQRGLGPGAHVRLTCDLWEALRGTDCAALDAKYREYLGLDLKRTVEAMRTRVLVDGRNAFHPAVWASAGFVVRVVGKG
jgi:UDPglucose 6-dehydrogenase